MRVPIRGATIKQVMDVLSRSEKRGIEVGATPRQSLKDLLKCDAENEGSDSQHGST